MINSGNVSQFESFFNYSVLAIRFCRCGLRLETVWPICGNLLTVCRMDEFAASAKYVGWRHAGEVRFLKPTKVKKSGPTRSAVMEQCPRQGRSGKESCGRQALRVKGSLSRKKMFSLHFHDVPGFCDFRDAVVPVEPIFRRGVVRFDPVGTWLAPRLSASVYPVVELGKSGLQGVVLRVLYVFLHAEP